MIKQFISFKSPSGAPVSRTLYFDLNEFEVTHDMELEVLQARLQKFQDEVIGDEKTLLRELTAPEKREMLDIVKILIRHSYGERRNDDEFWKEEQDPDIWKSFVASGAFNAFVLYLFEDTDRANNFMSKIWPEIVQKEFAKSQTADLSVVPEPYAALTSVGDDAPIYPGDEGIQSLDAPVQQEEEPLKKAWSDYTPEQLLEMSRDEFETLYAEGRRGNNVPAMLLNIRQRRKMAEGAEDGGTTE